MLEPSGRLTNVVVVDLDCVDSISEEAMAMLPRRHGCGVPPALYAATSLQQSAPLAFLVGSRSNFSACISLRARGAKP